MKEYADKSTQTRKVALRKNFDGKSGIVGKIQIMYNKLIHVEY